MAYAGVIARPDGSLYCDISVESLGFPQATPVYGLPIIYPQEKFDEMGRLFLAQARSTCPVDTGFLRDHNFFASDAGGIEMWSEAPYSVYQEYGTSRCKAQPWFESSIQSALIDSNIHDAFDAVQIRYMRLDGLLSTLSTMSFYTMYDALEGLRICDQIEEELALLGLDDDDGGMIDQITKDIANQIDVMYIQMAEMQQMGVPNLNTVEQMIVQFIAGIFGTLIRMLIDNIFLEHTADANPHFPSH